MGACGLRIVGDYRIWEVLLVQMVLHAAKDHHNNLKQAQAMVVEAMASIGLSHFQFYSPGHNDKKVGFSFTSMTGYHYTPCSSPARLTAISASRMRVPDELSLV